MNNFNRNNSGRRATGAGFRGNRTAGSSFDRRNRGRSEMFSATCNKCGKSCEVPFRPTSGKPVYCNSCFENKGGRGNKRFGRSDSTRRDSSDRYAGRSAMHQAICNKCGKSCEVPFRPTAGKPVFCSDCFETQGNGKKLTEQFDNLNAKLDKILSFLAPEVTSKPAPEENASQKENVPLLIEEIKIIKPKKPAKKTETKKKKSTLKDKE